MAKLAIAADAIAFLQKVERKHAGQIALKVFSLLAEPFPNDSQKLQGTKRDLWRADIGEYRIVYSFEDETVTIFVIGRRNDDDVYKEVARKRL